MSNTYYSVEQILAKDFVQKLREKELQEVEVITSMRLDPLEYNYKLGKIASIREIKAEFETLIKELFPH